MEAISSMVKVCQNRSVPTMKRLISSGNVDQLLIAALKTRESNLNKPSQGGAVQSSGGIVTY